MTEVQDRRERYLAVDGLLENFLNSRSNFCSVTINDPDLLTLLERAARHELEQNPLFGSRIVEHLDDDCFSFAEVRQQSQVVINFRPLHGRQIPRVLAKVFDAPCRAECVDRHKQIDAPKRSQPVRAQA